MRCKKLFLIAAGEIPDSELEAGSVALQPFWAGSLNQYSCHDSPNNVLNKLKEEDGLILLKGDAAQLDFEGCSWLESLGAWKIPVALFVSPTSSGGTPGVAYAYDALCKQLSVPVVGVVQLGGYWSFEKKKLDYLPWCGWLPSRPQENFISKDSNSFNHNIDSFDVAENLRRRLLKISFSN